MKLLSTLFILVALTACGKKAEFDGRNAGPNTPVGNNPVGTGQDESSFEAKNQIVEVQKNSSVTFSLESSSDTAPIFSIEDTPNEGRATQDEDNTKEITYTPDEHYVGSDSMKFKAHRGSESSSLGEVTFKIYAEKILNAKIGYTTGLVKVVNLNLPDVTYVHEKEFKLPQSIQVTDGWASQNATASFILKKDNGEEVSCTYKSEATVSHRNNGLPTDEKKKGEKYTFSNCSDRDISPTSIQSGFDEINLVINSADDLLGAEVEAIVRVY